MNSILGLFNFNRPLTLTDQEIKEFSTQFNTSPFLLPNSFLGSQPFSITYDHKLYTILFNGRLYNGDHLKQELLDLGYSIETKSDEELVLLSYIAFNKACLDKLDGMFSFIIQADDHVFGCRDPFGIKPLYYAYDQNLIVASEIKLILWHQKSAIVNREGILELLGLGPSLSPGHTIYKGIYSIKPGHYFIYTKDNFMTEQYYTLQSKPHLDDYDTTVKKVRDLLTKSILMQLTNDKDVACMLSGGIDSSIITAVAASTKPSLSTYSVDYENQKDYFKPYDYQTTRDEDYILLMQERYATKHHNIILKQEELATHLKSALIARDMPGMADIDSSFYCFLKAIQPHHQIILSGECADEIFGGYPWFYRQEPYERDQFPWLNHIDERLALFHPNIQKLPFKEYIQNAYHHTLSEIGPIKEDQRKKELTYLCIEWFMQTLLIRSETQAKLAGVECRVPFANKDLIDYVYNIPWDYLYHSNQEKALLRDAFKDQLPKEILHRKKNPYPKTHSPIYTDIVCRLLQESLEDKESILYSLFDKDKLQDLIDTKGASFKYPWFGQLMTGPQLIAYFYQIHLWGKCYHIQLEL